jgi:putative ABC transport system permease protein
MGFEIEGRPEPRPGEYTTADWRVVTPDYLRTLGIPLRQGRYLDRKDTADAPSVLLVNEAMAREYWPNENAVGKRMRADSDWWSTIVGVVGNIKTAGLDVPPEPEMYFPAAQVPRGATSLAIHTRGDPAKLAAAVVREIHAVDPGMPILQMSTMDEILDREVFGRRMQTGLLASFASVALLLAALGIYGVLAYAVARRTQEIGIRMALGARPADVLLTIAGQGMGWSAVGILIGVGGGLALTRVLSKMLFEVSATDPATFGVAAAVLLSVAWTASYIPARRAMKLDPIVALREE